MSKTSVTRCAAILISIVVDHAIELSEFDALQVAMQVAMHDYGGITACTRGLASKIAEFVS